MKLSEKGLKKFERHEQIKKLGYVSLIDEIEFEPDDFEGGCFQNGNDYIILPIEEARIIEHCLAFFKQRHKLYNSELKVWKLLQMRIEQAEKKNEV